jgi:signal transduction histidine kinase/CheY-like chemotaxis protein
MERRPTILIVDDRRDNINLLAQFLRTDDYAMSFATSGLEALESVQRNPPSLILLDVMMPDLNGYEVTHRIKSDPTLPFIPIILVTAKHELADKVYGLDAGADDYLSKPIQSRELLAKVRAFLRLKQSQDALMVERNKTDLLYRIQQQLTSSLDIDQVVCSTIISMVAMLDAMQGSVVVSDPRESDMWRKIVAYRDRDEREESFVTRQVIEEGLAGRAIRTGEPQILADTVVDDRWIVHEEQSLSVRSALAVPLIHRDEVLGVLTLTHPEPGHFRADQLPLVSAAAGQISTAINNAQLYGKLKEAERTREQFLHMLTHDLRGPLAGISGCLHVLGMGPVNEDHAMFIDMARAACKAQERLIDDILDVYKAEAGAMELDLSPVSLRECVPRVLGDYNKLVRVLTNLVGNSLKFTRKGGVFITAEVNDGEGQVYLSVRDTGVGIPAHDLEHIFDRFYQAPQPGDRRGTGLGLAFCREVINAHGGTIWAESTLGSGTVMTATLPIAKEAV